METSFALGKGQQLVSLMPAEASHRQPPFLFQIFAQLWEPRLQISNWIVRRMRKIRNVARQTRAATLIKEQLNERDGIGAVKHRPGGIEQIESLAEKFLQRLSFIGSRNLLHHYLALPSRR